MATVSETASWGCWMFSTRWSWSHWRRPTATSSGANHRLGGSMLVSMGERYDLILGINSHCRNFQFLVKVKVAQSSRTLCHGQWPLSMGLPRQEYWSGLPFLPPGESSWPRDRTWMSCIAGRFFTVWATREALVVSCKSCKFEVNLQVSCKSLIL